MNKLTKREKLQEKQALKARKAAEALANRKIVKSKLSKKQLAERNAQFSLSAYLQRKALRKAEKLTYRAAKRNGTLPEAETPAEAILHEHSHECNHDHDHEHAHVHIEEEQA